MIEYIPDPNLTRCGWSIDPVILACYHDQEWGTPLHDDRMLFEGIALDGMQAGLSWLTILRKRENFRKAFDGFQPGVVAEYGEPKIEELLQDAGIIRNRLKIQAIIHNARTVLKIQQEFGSLDAYLWGFVDGKPVHNRWETMAQIPARSELSDRVSKDMIQRGFKFCGSTIIYAFMQAAGLVNDHIISCYRYAHLTETV
jgi:DNA-3-methyladenine glycosylase I